MRKERKNLINVEIPRAQAEYLQQLYSTKNLTLAVKQGLNVLCSLDCDLALARDRDKLQALNISDEMKIRLMKTVGHADWRLAAMEVLIVYLDQHYKPQEIENA